MMMVAASPFGSLLMVFVAVPLGIVLGVYGRDGVSALRDRRSRSRRP